MEPFPIPTYLAKAAARDETDERREWVAALPGIVAGLAERWDLTVGQPYEPGGECSWVAPAARRSGSGSGSPDDGVTLKVGWRHTEAEHEADGLRFWAGDGAVGLLANTVFGSTSALLLERCEPGTPLARALPGPAQDEVVAGLLRRLWQRPPDSHPFRPLSSMCDYWADEYEEKFGSGPAGHDPGITRAGMSLYRELPHASDDDVLLCTDLHAENILAATREPWLVIDPKPYVGDRTYDPLQHILNDGDRLAANPDAFVSRMAALLDLDRSRLRLWLFARCVQESPEWDGLYDVALRLAP